MRAGAHRPWSIVLPLGLCMLVAKVASAQQPPATPAPPSTPSRLGIHGFATVGMDWMVANDTFDALGLDTRPVEVGGGVQVSGLWRDLFLQVNVSRWSSDGERAFVDDDGNVFPLGIPLDVRASYLDVTAGWKYISRGALPGRCERTHRVQQRRAGSASTAKPDARPGEPRGRVAAVAAAPGVGGPDGGCTGVPDAGCDTHAAARPATRYDGASARGSGRMVARRIPGFAIRPARRLRAEAPRAELT
jgi:hypothetical protein